MKVIFSVLSCFILSGVLYGQTTTFKVVPLGVKGGIDERNLSAYLVASADSENYVSLDAGTLYAGVKKAIKKGTFTGSASEIIRKNIKGYLISHGHLDHLSGLVINSPDDTSKNIYALPYVINILKEKYFTWESWANFADEGEKPTLNKYHYVPLDTAVETKLSQTEMSVRAFGLSHVNPYVSTAFLLRFKDEYLLYLGDTGADAIEKSGQLKRLWEAVAPIVKAGKLKAIFIEVSYPNEQPDNLLFGHLTPRLLMEEMNVLARLAGHESMDGLPIVITHLKPTGDNEKIIKRQLQDSNPLNLKVIFPVQGEVMRF